MRIPHVEPNMLISNEPVNYFRKMNSQSQQQQSFHDGMNIPRSHLLNIAPFERRIEGVSIATHHNGHSLVNEATHNIPSQLYRQQFEIPTLIRIKRDTTSQVEPNDDGHEIDSVNEQPVSGTTHG